MRLGATRSPITLDYIFTVDIFNEGVDIPEINQVIMLRPTESPIIFVQQLGRGLRKADGKEFVIVIDFIGNYQNNYMIPIALSGDRTGNKDNIRRSLMEGNNLIQGASTIYFDEVSRKRIYASIDEANLNRSKILKAEYERLKYKLGRIPLLKEFDEHGELDPLRIIQYSTSYHEFLKAYEPEYKNSFNKLQEEILNFVTYRFAEGLRIHEVALLKMLILEPENSDLWEMHLKNTYNVDVDELSRRSVRNVLSGQFFRRAPSCTSLIDTHCNNFKPSAELIESIKDDAFKQALLEAIDFAIYRYTLNYSKQYGNTLFCINKKYTYTDVCWLLNWEKDIVAQNIGGYKYDENTKTYPIFINYEKDDSISATTRYEDRFIDQSHLIAISKNNRRITSRDVDNAIHANERGILMPLFVRKNKDDKTSKEFYFLGTIRHNGYLEEFTMPNTNVPAVKIGYHLDTPVETNLYEYITEKTL